MQSETGDPEAGYQDQMPTGGFGLVLLKVTRAFAIAGGLVMLAIVVMTTLSVAGRYLLGMPVPGDYEIVEFGIGISIFLFFPYCEMSLGNIRAEFFTDRLPERWKELLNLVAEFAFLAIALLLTWRLAVGAMKKMADGQVYMHLPIQLWWGYVFGIVSMALLALVCGWRIADYYRRMKDAEPR
jgi:TRAP-type C4-dicarboxylate transport system permease small subunit